MNKENFLFGIIGLLLGLIIGFFFTNSVNQRAMMPAGAMAPAISNSNSALPPGHPEVPPGQSAQGGASVASMQEVQEAVQKAKSNPSDFEAQMKAAELYYQIGRFDDTIEYLLKANKLKPETYEIIVGIGNSNFDGGHFDEAEKWYTTALQKKPDDVSVRTDLGLTFLFRANPDYDRAIKEFTRSLEIDPVHVQTLQNLTVAYTKKGDATKAKATLARLESADPTNDALAKLREDIGKL